MDKISQGKKEYITQEKMCNLVLHNSEHHLYLLNGISEQYTDECHQCHSLSVTVSIGMDDGGSKSGQDDTKSQKLATDTKACKMTN